MKPQKIAIIGGGVTGLVCARLLDKQYAITLYEKNAYIGGHSNTISVHSEAREFKIDTGFVVFNNHNYPLFKGLLDELGVASQATAMTFSASLDDGEFEYAGTNLATLLGSRRACFSFEHWQMLLEIIRFNRHAKAWLENSPDPLLTLSEFLHLKQFRKSLAQHYLLPMAAAIWSCPLAKMHKFPALSLLRFFDNHGLLSINNRPQWRTVRGGSHAYVQTILRALRGQVIRDCPVEKIVRSAQGVWVHSKKRAAELYDKVIFCCHADQALHMLNAPLAQEAEVLAMFDYQKNHAVLHCDQRLLPKRRWLWSSWNYFAQSKEQAVSVSYWMNRLHNLHSATQFIVSLNPIHAPREELVIDHFEYRHPVFDQRAIAAQQRLNSLQACNGIYYAGSYFGHGFHEDAVRAAAMVSRHLVTIPAWMEAEISHLQPNKLPINQAVLTS